MHIPDGFLDPKTWGTLSVASVGTTGYALYKMREKMDEKMIPLLGITAAFIFAAQMLNFPVAGGTSGHYLGAILACVLLGAWPGLLVMVVVLLVQCLFFADGGLTALGANIFNMAIIGGLLSYYLLVLARKPLSKAIGEKSSLLVTTAFFSWLSVVLASAACALELSISNIVKLSPGAIFGPVVGVNCIIGIGEAVITTIVVAVVLQARPDLVYAYSGKGLPKLPMSEEAV